MTKLARFVTVASFSCAIVNAAASASAQTGPAPTPTPAPTPSAASDPCGSLISIVTRPTMNTGVCTVRPGHALMENGYTNIVVTGPGGGNTVQYPESLLRIGTFDPHLDFEVGPVTEIHSTVGGTRQAGLNDLALGAKYELGYTSNFLYGVNAVVTIPTANQAFGAGNAQFTGNFNWAYTINSEFGISGTLGANAFSGYTSSNAAQSYFDFTPAIDFSAALPGGPSQVVAEFAYNSAAGPNLGGRSFFDFAYQRDFGNHVQIDVEYGVSPTTILGQREHYVGAGLSFMN